MDSVQRFTSRVEDYARYRPTYPPALLDLLQTECGLTPEFRVADIGSGTGLLTQRFLQFGCTVTGVEPNAKMRAAGDAYLAAFPKFHSVEGRAESTGLPDHSVDLVTAAQAFHWFDPPQARAEFQRILTAPGWVALIWNERREVNGLMDGYEDLVRRYGPEPRHILTQEIQEFFGGRLKQSNLPNQQVFDITGLKGRFLSASYAPLPGTERYASLMEELDRLFAAHEQDGRVTLIYETEVYLGRLSPAAGPGA